MILDDGHDELVFVICDFCKHQRKHHETCDAFSNGIPKIILTGNNNHDKPLPGQDNDIVFEAIEEDKI